MKSTVTTLIKFLLLGCIVVLLFFLVKPVKFVLPELEPLEKKENTELSGDEFIVPETPKESEPMVAMLFGWVPPKSSATPRPVYTGPALPHATPAPAIELWLKVRKGVIEDKGKLSYWIKNMRTSDGFWLTEGETNREGYRFIRLVPEGILVLYQNQYKIIKNE